MYDCAWSPQHPALFAAVDGTGRLDLWNLNKDTEVASASVTVEGGAALNRVTWTQSGLHVAAGDDCGKIWVYDVGEQLAVPQPDEWNKFAHTLQVTQRSATPCVMNSLGQPIWGFCPILSSILYINWRFQNAVNTS